MGRSLLIGILILSWGLFPVSNRNISIVGQALPSGITVNLPVTPSKQLKLTSCGEAAIAMAYRYFHPNTTIDERAILTYAEAQGYYNEKKWPFTSPANMVKITQHYEKGFLSGTVADSEQGLALLISNLENGNPVIVDLLTKLDDPRSGAHFVLVTGIKIPADNKYAVTIFYNDPITGKNKSSPWYGDSGVWNAWHNNGDPGGAGWWLVIPVSTFEN